MINSGNAPGNLNKNINLNLNEMDGFENYEGQNDCLLTLIHPELDMLSKNWQAALKDHALLLLPCGKYFYYFKHNHNNKIVLVITVIILIFIFYNLYLYPNLMYYIIYAK